MCLKICRLTLLALLLSSNLFAAERYVIPYATAGSPVYLQNASSATQLVQFADQYMILLPMTTQRIEAAGEGRLVINSSGPILAWAVVDGVVFEGMTPVSQVALLVTRLTGLAIAADDDSMHDIQMDVYDGPTWVCGLSGGLVGGQTLIGWAADLLPDLPEGEFTLVVSSSGADLAVGASRFRNGLLESVPIQKK